MNMQEMLRQAQTIQKEMLKEKQAIDQNIYETTKGPVTVKTKGTKEVLEVKIVSMEEEKEIIEDLLVVAINENNKKIDEEVEKKLGKYTKGMPGLL